MCTTHKPFSAMCISVTIFDIKQKVLLEKSVRTNLIINLIHPLNCTYLADQSRQRQAEKKDRLTLTEKVKQTVESETQKGNYNWNCVSFFNNLCDSSSSIKLFRLKSFEWWLMICSVCSWIYEFTFECKIQLSCCWSCYSPYLLRYNSISWFEVWKSFSQN